MKELREIPWLTGKYGVMCHYLIDQHSILDKPETALEEWIRQVESFDAEALAEQVAESGASWLIFTIGQNTGYYCSPNKTYDSIVGRTPSRLTNRDLMADIASALKKRNVRLIAYLSSHAPAFDRMAVEAMQCTPRWNASKWQLQPGTYLRTEETDERLSVFQRNWEAIVREWSERWGNDVSGWWIDGCYYANKLYNHPDEPCLKSFAAALRAGNPDSKLAFNPGVKIACYGEEEDYTAGETMHDLPVWQWNGGYSPLGKFIGNSQLHILTHLGRYWRAGDAPRFNDALICGYTNYINSLGGGFTWDVPISSEGKIPPIFIDTLKKIKL